ncbi:alpha/beta fold hydrolase [Streptomyces sp. B1866]|uniref:alpha/beta fold hydrolase n=1 Tax=Streptomyces sp. B1866 TaxID=3075431 RepID=UPI00288FA5CD|nr:alpha/beta fold hydrolase [Streptomyces sp. B1866]MDT3395135.1 alpha/beta fold hydrolase [Streptomyces sp. B1866]
MPLNEESRPAEFLTVPTALGEVSVRLSGRVGDDAPALLLLHANPGDSRDFDAVLPALEREFAVAAPDWPGFGRSTAPYPDRVGAEDLVDVAEDVLDALAARGLRRFAVVGNSVGGYVAARLARRRTAATAAVVLVSPGGFTRHSPVTRAFCRRVMGRPARARWLVRPLARAYLGRLATDSIRATYARACAVPGEPRRLAVHCALWRSFAEPGFDLTDPAAGPAGTGVPVLLVWGRRDPVVPAATDGRRARRALPDAASSALPTGHEPYNERPELFLAHVLPFLREHAGRPGESGAPGTSRPYEGYAPDGAEAPERPRERPDGRPEPEPEPRSEPGSESESREGRRAAG